MNDHEDSIEGNELPDLAVTEPGRKPLQLNPKRESVKKKNKWWLFASAGVAVVALGVGSYFGYDYYMHADDVVVPEAQEFVAYQESRDNLCDDFEEVSLSCSVKWVTNDEADRGNILSQSIASGSEVSKGSNIVLTYSDGPTKAEFPNLVAQNLEESKELLYELGIDVSDVKEVADNTVQAGDIVSTSIEPGTVVEHGSDVVIEISEGKVDVPDWIGETKEKVDADANEHNITIQFEEAETDATSPGIVIKQSVKAGSKVGIDETIVITVAKAPEIQEIPVPDILGLTEEEALSQLAVAGFNNISTTVVPASVEARTVSAVEPGAGQLVPSDRTIVVVIAEPENAETTTTPDDERNVEQE